LSLFRLFTTWIWNMENTSSFTADRRKPAGVILALLALLLAVAALLLMLRGKSSNDSCFSVAHVWKNARSFDGERICIRGKAEYLFGMTAVSCCPPHCDCNETWGELRLVSEEQTTYNPRVSGVDYISLDTPICRGNECSISCFPFDPSGVDYFEFVGTLTVSDCNGEPAWLELTDLNISTSQQLVDGDWGPIPTRTFVKVFTKSTPIPNSCKETE
jgi:hypothetical protein